MDLGSIEIERALSSLGALLAARHQSLDVAVIGGSAMLLAGLSKRATQDVDVVGPVVDDEVVVASRFSLEVTLSIADVGDALGLAADWLNLGAASLVDLGLPDGFIERAETRRFDALTVRVADRVDQIHFKLYASADAGPKSKHFADLRVLTPSTAELEMAAAWCRTHDPSPGFAEELKAVLATFASLADG